ncbi:hypothetical protein GM418_08705 [Maribellus comscasis]|uniref:HEAT repeat domain-containing protein n=1 Tax=Maribellus comscasis TaxID=2681766 RepID=A0A6I6K1C6_9BACT|nr:HEAT repeat domain-containing protein [Maribellus comscasis]QGY43734.1 hypothetical protein GM418_08705 [Maribellus comscasis]
MEKRNTNNDFEEFIKNQPVREDEKEDLYKLFSDLDNIEVPEPSESMETNFFRKLEDYKLKQTSNPGIGIKWLNLKELFAPSALILKPAFAVIIFLAGIIGGILIDNRGAENRQLIAELQNTRETLMLTLFEQSSAIDRLKAVNLSEKLVAPDQQVIQALLTTLNNDDNVNVRLAAVEALFRYSNQPEVREGLIEAIPNQDSPMVLITLSKAMVLLQEKKSVENLKQILNDKNLDQDVKNKIDENIQKII